MTVQERIKAKEVCENDYGLKHRSSNGMSKSAGVTPRRIKGIKSKSNLGGFSTNEKLLYREYNTI